MPDVAPAETNPTGESPAVESSFQERMRQRLSTERASGEPTGPPDGYEVNPSDEVVSEVVGDGYEDALDSARQVDGVDESELEDKPTGEVDDTETAIPESSDDPEDAPVELSPEHQELVQRAEEAEQARSDMERDYRIKTHKIAAATRELEDDTTVVKQQAEFILGIAEAGVKQFDTVNWTDLQTKPEEYQRMRQMFNGAIQQRDQLKKQLGGIAENHQAMLEAAKTREAAVSKDILRSTVKDWSNELYGKLREFAVAELSYTAEEYDDLTDWRRLRDIHSQFQMAQAPKRVTRLRRKKGKQPANRQRERQAPQIRNASGQFAKARQAFHDNPGGKEERRTFFMAKLQAERR